MTKFKNISRESALNDVIWRRLSIVWVKFRLSSCFVKIQRGIFWKCLKIFKTSKIVKKCQFSTTSSKNITSDATGPMTSFDFFWPQLTSAFYAQCRSTSVFRLRKTKKLINDVIWRHLIDVYSTISSLNFCYTSD